MIIYANGLLRSLFSGKNKKSISSLSSAELTQRVVKVNTLLIGFVLLWWLSGIMRIRLAIRSPVSSPQPPGSGNNLSWRLIMRYLLGSFLPASVARMCIQLVMRRLRVWPRRVCNILSWSFDHEIFSMVILSLPLIQEGQLSVSGERMCTSTD